MILPAKIRSAGNLLQNPQEVVIATYICFLTNFTELELTNIQAKYWWGQMHCGKSNHNFVWPMAHPPGWPTLQRRLPYTTSATVSKTSHDARHWPTAVTNRPSTGCRSTGIVAGVLTIKFFLVSNENNNRHMSPVHHRTVRLRSHDTHVQTDTSWCNTYCNTRRQCRSLAVRCATGEISCVGG